jgi:hypothetical protein
MYFGHPAALQDENLFRYFVKTNVADGIGKIGDPRCIVVGKKGAGKTALARAMAHADYPLRVVAFISARTHQLPPAKHALSHAQFANVFEYEILLELLRNFVKHEKAPKLFTKTFNAKVYAEGNEYLKKLGEAVNLKELSIDTPVFGIGASKADTDTVVRLTATRKLQSLRARISEITGKGIEFLVLIDDPDLLFGDVAHLVPVVGGLLLAAVDLTSTIGQLKICVFVKQHRWDQLDWNFEDFDQIRQNAVALSWTETELSRLIAERIWFRTGKVDADDLATWRTVFAIESAAEFKAMSNYLFERLTNGPRDLIEFCNLARQAADDAGNARITQADITAVEPQYSKECLKEVQREYHQVYPDIAEVVQKIFEHADLRKSKKLARATLAKALSDRYRSDDIQDMKRDVKWLRDQTGAGLIEVLFKVGVIGFISSASTRHRVMSYSSRGVADSVDNADEFFVHPAYHRALGVA